MLNKNWQDILSDEQSKQYYIDLMNFINKEYNTKTIFPSKNEIFNFLNRTSFEKIKVVILGQDPYHGPNEAEGLAFSLNENCKITPSLRNIFKELNADLSIDRNNKSLFDWADQGVLLMNYQIKCHFR